MTRATKSKPGTPPAPTIPAIPPADVLGRLAALKTTTTPDLKQQWRELFQHTLAEAARVGVEVRLTAAAGWGMGGPGMDGVKVFNAAGAPIGFIDLPERCANVCFGGRYRNRLFMAAAHSLYSLYVNTQGVAGG
jgi:hypothetical protein